MIEIPRNVVFYEHGLDALKKIPDECVQMVVTSPPYWGLRKYSGEQEVVWGGNPNCEHNWVEHLRPPQGGKNLSDNLPNVSSNKILRDTDLRGIGTKSDFCSLCGCWRGALGLEPQYSMYVAHLVEILREIKRVLRRDGTLWLNLGDSYAGSNQGHGTKDEDVSQKQLSNRGTNYMLKEKIVRLVPGLKSKDMCGIPWRVAFALQEAGWFLRSAICWSKLNPMPESVNGWRWERHRRKDKKTREWFDCPGCPACEKNDGLVLRKGAWRPTKSYEFIFMFSKSAIYYCDAEAVRVPLADATLPRYLRGVSENTKWKNGADGQTQHTMSQPRKNIRKEFEASMGGAGTSFKGHSGYLKEDGTLLFNPAGRNLRDVWTFSTEGFPGSHFAVFPENLPETCIKAATSPKVCPHCGASWARIVKKEWQHQQQSDKTKAQDTPDSPMYRGGHHNDDDGLPYRGETTILGWKPTCKCPANDGSGKALVLDPFAGSGTTLAVAAKLGRDYLGIEISKEYEPLIKARLAEAEHGLTPKDQELGQKPLF